MKNRKGSSSILVILIIITLVIFGVFSVLNSYSGFKLSQVSLNTLEKQYALESTALIAKMDVIRELETIFLDGDFELSEMEILDLKKGMASAGLFETFEIHQKEDHLYLEGVVSQVFENRTERLKMQLLFIRSEDGKIAYEEIEWNILPSEFDYQESLMTKK